MRKELSLSDAVAYALSCLNKGRIKDAQNFLNKLPQDEMQTRLAQARLVYVQGDNQRAFTMANHLLKDENEQPEVMAFWCYLCAKSGEMSKIRPFLAKLEKKNPTTSWYWGDLAVVFYLGKNYHAALQCATKSLSGDPDRVEIWRILGAAQRDSGNPRAAISSYFRALALEPFHGESYLHLSVFFEEVGEFEKAATFLQLAKNCGVDNQQIGLREAHGLLQDGRLKEGFQKYRIRYDGVKISKTRPNSTLPIWNGQDIAGKKILVYCEQGAGDVIQFSRFLIELALRDAQVTFLCRKNLCRLIAHSIPSIQVCDSLASCDGFDYQSYLIDLAIFMDISVDRMPHCQGYLTPPCDKFGDVAFQDKPRIGFVWHGGTAHLRDHLRSIPLSVFEELLRLDQFNWVSLQPDPNAHLPAGDHIVDVTSDLNDFGDTAALIDKLDLVISVDTAVVHLAGAMGKPVWLLLDQCADWRWQKETQRSYWYQSVCLFRQSEFGDWIGVINRVKQALKTAFP